MLYLGEEETEAVVGPGKLREDRRSRRKVKVRWGNEGREERGRITSIAAPSTYIPSLKYLQIFEEIW